MTNNAVATFENSPASPSAEPSAMDLPLPSYGGTTLGDMVEAQKFLSRGDEGDPEISQIRNELEALLGESQDDGRPSNWTPPAEQAGAKPRGTMVPHGAFAEERTRRKEAEAKLTKVEARLST